MMRPTRRQLKGCKNKTNKHTSVNNVNNINNVPGESCLACCCSIGCVNDDGTACC